MNAIAKSTIAALCYARPTELNFQELVAELGQALWDNPHINVRINAQYDDFVIFDLPTVRICLAHSDLRSEFPETRAGQSYAECLVISVGSGPNGPGVGPFFENRADLCGGLVDRVEERHPSDRFMLLEREDVFTEEIYDALLEQISSIIEETLGNEGDAVASAVGAGLQQLGSGAKSAEHGTEPDVIETLLAAEAEASAPKAQPSKASAFGPVSPGDILPGLAARYDEECARRDKAAAGLVDEAANDPAENVAREAVKAPAKPEKTGPRRVMPKPTHPAAAADKDGAEALKVRVTRPIGQTESIRMALYPMVEELEEDARSQPILHRVAINALNTSVMAFSLPVGAALLTVAIFGRESMALSSRVTALTGSAMGIWQSDMAGQMLSYFV